MNCNIVRDLIPLYIDRCCSEESAKAVQEHINVCKECKNISDDMKNLPDMVKASDSIVTFNKLNDWKASILQSVLLFLSFALITVGVALEAKTSEGLMNGFWAWNLIVPSTGFMLSLANWYFIRVYKSKKAFSYSSLIATVVITLCAYIQAVFHYQINPIDMFAMHNFSYVAGIWLSVVFCVLSKLLSQRYATMIGKE